MNLRKFTAVALTAIMALSSASAFAENEGVVDTSIDPGIFRLENQKNTEERGFVIKDGAIYDLAGRFQFYVSEDGKLASGDYLDENFHLGYPKSEWSGDAIDRAVELGIIPVLMRYDYIYSINRYEFAVIAYNMLDKSGKITDKNAPAGFTDTNSEEINILAKLGIVSGKSSSKFAPNAKITREEATTILARVADYAKLTASTDDTPKYDDNDTISGWAVSNVYKVKALGIMQGEVIYNEEGEEDQYTNLFKPQSEITKEESIVSLMRIYDKIK